MSTFLHKTSNPVWLRRAHYRFFTWDKEVLIIYICIDYKSLKHIYVPKSRDCVNLYFLDRVKNIFGCVNVHSDYSLELLHINIKRTYFHRVDRERLAVSSSPFWSRCPAPCYRLRVTVFTHYVLVLTQVFKFSSSNKRLKVLSKQKIPAPK